MLNTQSVWVVDDNELFRRAVARLIRGREATASCAEFSTMEQALERLRTSPRDLQPDVLLLDVGLPGLTGIEGLHPALELAPATKVVIVTAFEDPDRILQAFQQGASGYILKDQFADDIDRVINEVAAGGVPMTGRVARYAVEMMAKHTPAAAEARCRLSNREREILSRLVDGLTKKEIATAIGLSVHTVNTHLRRVYEKLNVNTNTAAVAYAIRSGLI